MIGKIGNVSFGSVWVKADKTNGETGKKFAALMEILPEQFPGVEIKSFKPSDDRKDMYFIIAPQTLGSKKRKDLFDSGIAKALETIGIKEDGGKLHSPEKMNKYSILDDNKDEIVITKPDVAEAMDILSALKASLGL